MNRMFLAWLCLCLSGMLSVTARSTPAEYPLAGKNLSDQKDQWIRYDVGRSKLNDKEVRAFNAVFEDKKIPAIIINR